MYNKACLCALRAGQRDWQISTQPTHPLISDIQIPETQQ